jgi:hypothetical protein
MKTVSEFDHLMIGIFLDHLFVWCMFPVWFRNNFLSGELKNEQQHEHGRF